MKGLLVCTRPKSRDALYQNPMTSLMLLCSRNLHVVITGWGEGSKENFPCDMSRESL